MLPSSFFFSSFVPTTIIIERKKCARIMHHESRAKGYYCTMVRGPCRGALCDFWARAKIRNATVNELVAKAEESITECMASDGGIALKEALRMFWKDFGLKNPELLSNEEPALYRKIELVEQAILSQ